MIKRIFTLLAVAALLTAVMCFPASAEEIQEAQVKEIIYDFDLTETELRVDSKRVRGMSLTYLLLLTLRRLCLHLVLITSITMQCG